jgi:glycosyltransferase involved in cell wall biosynthesis
MSNILVDLHRTGGNAYNGLYHFCYQLGKQLAVEVQPGMHLHFYVPRAQRNLFGSNVDYVTQYSLHKFYQPGTNRFDVWHIATTLSWYRPFGSKTKNIYTIHDLNFLKEEEYAAAIKKKYLTLIQQRINRADHLTFISNFARQQALEYLKVDDKPYDIIYNGCNLPARVSDEPIYRPRSSFLFSIGQLHSRKNFHVLPALLVGNDHELVIAGMNDFPYTEKVLQEAKRHKVEDRVRLIGPVTEEDKAWYYKNCEAFLFPSIGEGFGLPVIEAMYFGKPVFLSTYTSLPEIGGDVAYYFENFEPGCMQQVFEKGMNDFRSGRSQEAIIRRAQSFSWKKAAEEYLTVYRKFL